MPYADYGAYPGQESPAEFHSVSGTLTTSASAVPIPYPAGRVYVQIIGGGGAYINFNGDAETNNFRIPAGGVFVYQGRPVSQLSLRGVSGGEIYSVHAN